MQQQLSIPAGQDLDSIDIDAVDLDGPLAVVGKTSWPAGPQSGAVHVFERAEGSWSWSTVVRPPPDRRLAWFGRSVALDDERLLVLSGEAEAFLYRRTPSGTWLLEHVLDPVLVGLPDGVALAGSLAVVYQRDDWISVFAREGENWLERGSAFIPSADDCTATIGPSGLVAGCPESNQVPPSAGDVVAWPLVGQCAQP